MRRRQRTSERSQFLSWTHFEWDPKRVAFLRTDLSKPSFDLPQGQYSQIQQEATLVIHNAWQVNLNMSLNSSEPQVGGVRQILDFSSQSPKQTAMFFISTAGGV